MAAKQSTTERAIRHLIRRATKARDWTMIVLLFHELGTLWEQEAGEANENGSKSGDLA
jgi:hypothetical protein